MKKASESDFQPGDVTAIIANVPRTKIEEIAATNAFRRFFFALALRLETSNSLGCQVPPKSYSWFGSNDLAESPRLDSFVI